jgi:hypothetical protein
VAPGRGDAGEPDLRGTPVGVVVGARRMGQGSRRPRTTTVAVGERAPRTGTAHPNAGRSPPPPTPRAASGEGVVISPPATGGVPAQGAWPGRSSNRALHLAPTPWPGSDEPGRRGDHLIRPSKLVRLDGHRSGLLGRRRAGRAHQPATEPNPCQIQRRPTEYSGEPRGHDRALPDESPDVSSQVRGHSCSGGGSRIRTLEGISRRIYSPLRLRFRA